MVEIPAARVAQQWADAVASDDQAQAWQLMDPATRLALVQDWLAWAGPDLLAVKARGRDAVLSDLASSKPAMAREFEALTSRLFIHWEDRMRDLRPCVALEGEAVAEDVFEVALASTIGGGHGRVLMHRTPSGWRVASFDGYGVPTPGSPPDLAGMTGAGHRPVRRV